MDYKEAGVDVHAGYKAVELMKKYVSSTYNEGVINDIGGFGGLFSIKGALNMQEPVLVSGTDGVGTKLKVAFNMDKHDTIGIDCVAMCVNDIICSGAKPLFFLDYIACGKNVPERIATLVEGVAKGCRESGCALIGGETAEMPGFYEENEYDMAGFAVGIVDKTKVIDGSKLEQGDILVGLSSSGIHSNGYSLVRKIVDMNNLDEYVEELGETVGESILKPTKLYVKAIEEVMKVTNPKAISHITGGGFIENIPRMLKEGTRAIIKKDSWNIPPIFSYLEKKGKVNNMYNIYNMGIGMIVAVEESKAKKVLEALQNIGEEAYIIGEVITGEKGVEIC